MLYGGTSDKCQAASQKFSEDRGLPKLEHVLLPRVKGMVDSIMPNLRDSLDAIYDVTIVYEKPPANALSMMGSGKGTSNFWTLLSIPQALQFICL